MSTPKRNLRIAWWDLEAALTSAPSEMIDWYLDLETGEVIHILQDPGLSDDLDEEIDVELPRYTSIPRVGGREEHAEMTAFAEGVDERDLRERLLDALDGKGAFRRFRDVLSRYPDLDAAWRARRDAWLEEVARTWLSSIGVDATLVRPKARSAPPPQPQRRALRPALLHVLVLGAPDGKTEIIDGRVRRSVPGGDAPRALFKELVRELCDWKGVGYRKRFIEGTNSFTLEDVEIRAGDDEVEVFVQIPPEIAEMFFS